MQEKLAFPEIFLFRKSTSGLTAHNSKLIFSGGNSGFSCRSQEPATSNYFRSFFSFGVNLRCTSHP
jgi:hypothetical protein